MMRTIAAAATALVPSGIGIVRISGPEAHQITEKVFTPADKMKKLEQMQGYTAAYGYVHDMAGKKIDDAIALVFRAPKSYTGEDTVELSCHGGVYVVHALLKVLYQAGASPAQAGEFTKRAFLNGKMDLTQAEAVMEIIQSQSEQAARTAMSEGDGALSEKVHSLIDRVIEINSHLAAWADFPDEDIPQIDEDELKVWLEDVLDELRKLYASYDQGRLIREGVDTVIVGRANAGKSTLMNRLSGYEKSIVTEYEGTTRDIVEEHINLSGMMLKLSDTAGIRETDDPVERIGVALSKKKLAQADLVLAVFDGSKSLSNEDYGLIEQLDPKHTVIIINKADLEKGIDDHVLYARFDHIVEISIKHDMHIHELEESIQSLFHLNHFDPSQAMIFTERQRQEVNTAIGQLREAIDQLKNGMTLDAITVCVESALHELLELTGKRVSEQVIERVFEKFCVGK